MSATDACARDHAARRYDAGQPPLTPAWRQALDDWIIQWLRQPCVVALPGTGRRGRALPHPPAGRGRLFLRLARCHLPQREPIGAGGGDRCWPQRGDLHGRAWGELTMLPRPFRAQRPRAHLTTAVLVVHLPMRFTKTHTSLDTYDSQRRFGDSEGHFTHFLAPSQAS